MTHEDAQDRTAKLPALLTYDQLLQMNVRMASIDGKLDMALRRGDEHEKDLEGLRLRVEALEKSNIATSTRGGMWRTALDSLWALLLALIAAGVFFKH